MARCVSRASLGCVIAFSCTVVSTATRSRSLISIAPVRCAKASESGIPKRKKSEAHTRLSCKIGYLLTSNPADQSTASEFFTEDELSRRLLYDTVAPVYLVTRSIRTQPRESLLDCIAQPLVRADHANGDIPVEVRLTLVEIQDADRLVRMRQIEIARNCRRDRRRVDLMIGQGFEAVHLEPEGRCRHATLIDDHRRHGSDLNPDFGWLGKSLERREFAGQRHGESDTRAIVVF